MAKCKALGSAVKGLMVV